MNRSVLICGASFAGLSTAYWMATFGYRVTVVELASGPKKGGTPVNIQDRTIDIVKRMGLLDQIREHALKMEVMEFKNAADVTERSSIRQQPVGNDAHDEYEIERDVLLEMLFDAVEDKVEFMFGDSIHSLTDETHQVAVSFKRNKQRTFDLVIGCDGVHSTVRRLCFGDEAQFLRYLGAYFSITIVDQSLIPENTTQMYNEPGIAVMLNAYNQKTDICLCFQSEDEIPHDYRNEDEQRRIIAERFANVGWRTPELLAQVRRSDSFYLTSCATRPCPRGRRAGSPWSVMPRTALPRPPVAAGHWPSTVRRHWPTRSLLALAISSARSNNTTNRFDRSSIRSRPK